MKEIENPETLLLELEEFNKKWDQDDQIPANLENFIEYVSKSGTYIYPWSTVQKLYLKKLSNVINNLPTCLSTSGMETLNNSNSFLLNTTSNNNEINNIQLIKERIMERMQSFTSAPFTIQRISELLLKPSNHYNRVDKYLRGLEKCIMVVTTIDSNGSKIFIELNLTNGVQSNSISPVTTPTRPLTPVNKSTDQIETVMPSTAEPIESNETIEATVEVNISESNNIQQMEQIAVSTTTVYIEEQTMISNEQISMTISEKIETDEAIVTDTVDENDVAIELAEPESDQITE